MIVELIAALIAGILITLFFCGICGVGGRDNP